MTAASGAHAAIFRHLDEHFPEHLELARALIRQPSISLDGVGVRDCAALLLGMLQDVGCQRAELAEFSDGEPVV